MNNEISKKDLCPCGSGKRIKKCHGLTLRIFGDCKDDYDNILLNRLIAYAGVIGSQRERFCIDYIKSKQKVLKPFEIEQNNKAKSESRHITCEKGCSYCCSHYVEASIQECEAIVYYIYHHEYAFQTFIKNYKIWRKQQENSGDIFKKLLNSGRELINSGFHTDKQKHHEYLTNEYLKQGIQCPFLDNNLCVIYEVRPYRCAGYTSVTPPEWCNPVNMDKGNNQPTILLTWFSHTKDTSFYYQDFNAEVVTCLSVGVYDILRSGYNYLYKLPGLSGLLDKVSSDPKILKIYKRIII